MRISNLMTVFGKKLFYTIIWLILEFYQIKTTYSEFYRKVLSNSTHILLFLIHFQFKFMGLFWSNFVYWPYFDFYLKKTKFSCMI